MARGLSPPSYTLKYDHCCSRFENHQTSKSSRSEFIRLHRINVTKLRNKTPEILRFSTCSDGWIYLSFAERRLYWTGGSGIGWILLLKLNSTTMTFWKKWGLCKVYKCHNDRNPYAAVNVYHTFGKTVNNYSGIESICHWFMKILKRDMLSDFLFIRVHNDTGNLFV